MPVAGGGPAVHPPHPRTGLGGVRVSDQQMAALLLTDHEWHGDWSYTLPPSRSRTSASPRQLRSTSPPRPDLAWPYDISR